MEKFQNFLGSLKQPFLNTADFILGGEGFISGKPTPSTNAFATFLKSTETNDKGKVVFKDGKNLIDGYASLFKDGESNPGGILKGIKDIFSGGNEEKQKENTPERDYLDENKQLLKEIADLGEQARNKNFMREGIRTLANAPLIGEQAQMVAAEGINNLTIANMGAMAAQNRVLEANPPKQKIAGRYFRG